MKTLNLKVKGDSYKRETPSTMEEWKTLCAEEVLCKALENEVRRRFASRVSTLAGKGLDADAIALAMDDWEPIRTRAQDLDAADALFQEYGKLDACAKDHVLGKLRGDMLAYAKREKEAGT